MPVQLLQLLVCVCMEPSIVANIKGITLYWGYKTKIYFGKIKNINDKFILVNF